MRWKIRVRDKRGNIHTHRFCDAEAAFNHYVLYAQDIDTGYYEWVEMWKLRKNLVATGEPGEEVWTIVQRYPNED